MKIYNISEIPEGLRVPSYEEVLLSGYTDGYDDGYNTYPCYKKMYLTIEATGDGSISVSKNLEYSINGGPWVSVASGGYINVSSGDKTRFKGINAGNGTFVWTGVRSIVYGNIMSIMYGDEYIGKTSIPSGQSFESCFSSANITDASNLVLPATNVPKKGYFRMFQGCQNLVTAPELPALVFEGQECYAGMFQGCQSLVKAPALPAETLSLYCYASMFWGCTSLTTAPELPATTLAGMCYDSMFRGCTSITVAPALPATELDYGCYTNMFYGCTSLVEAPELPSTTLHGNCYAGMFERCTSLVEAPELPATDLNNIPGMMLQYNYANMFRGCTSLVTAPELPAWHLSNACYKDMFAGCTSLVNAPVLNAEFIFPNSYDGMFSGCTSLEYVECMAKSHSANDTTYTGNWMDGVPANGVFKCDCEYNWSRDSSGIPAGWTVIDNCPPLESRFNAVYNVGANNLVKIFGDSGATAFSKVELEDGTDITSQINNGWYTASQSGQIRVFLTPANTGETEVFAYAFGNYQPYIPNSGGASLYSIVIPDGYTSIGEGAFRGCNDLSEVVLPGGITTVKSNGFCCCYDLDIELPNTLTEIWWDGFAYCTSITNLTIPSGITYIESSSFLGIGVREIVVPATVTVVDSGAFSSCENLTSVTIGNNVTYVGDGAFLNCSGITEMIFERTSPPMIGSMAPLGQTEYTFPIYVPDVSVDAYKEHMDWVDYASRVKGISERQ